MIYSSVRPIKKREGAVTFHEQLFCQCLQLRQEPLTVSEIGKNENPLVSAFYQMKSKETKMDNNDSFSYETKKEKKKNSPSQTVLPLLATTSRAADGE